jgi:hypothetical protein
LAEHFVLVLRNFQSAAQLGGFIVTVEDIIKAAFVGLFGLDFNKIISRLSHVEIGHFHSSITSEVQPGERMVHVVP